MQAGYGVERPIRPSRLQKRKGHPRGMREKFSNLMSLLLAIPW